MRDRIVFFILGALLATLAYFAGDMQLSAHNTEIEGRQIIPKLFVEDIQVLSGILVGSPDRYRIYLRSTREEAGIELFSPNGKPSFKLKTTHEATTLSLFSPNGKQIIALVTEDKGVDGAFIGIRDSTGKMRVMDTNSVNIIVNAEPNSR